MLRRANRVIAVMILPLLCLMLAPQAAGQGKARQGPTKLARGPAAARVEIRAVFDEYLKLHEAKDMTAWPQLFLPEAVCVRTADDGKMMVYKPTELAASIAEEARKLDAQHETFEDVRIDIDGDAAAYSTEWRLFHNDREVRRGRAWYSLVRKDGAWRIASLVWYRQAGGGIR